MVHLSIMADMTSLNISLPESMKKFIEEQVEKGGYGTASEYVRGLVRAAQEKEGERLDKLLLEGLESGDLGPMTKQDWDRIREEVRRRTRRSKSA
jgi:antitoxin ParD1/3/4